MKEKQWRDLFGRKTFQDQVKRLGTTVKHLFLTEDIRLYKCILQVRGQVTMHAS
jgi:hypothetical protein